MTENRKKVLEMLAENKISAEEAYRLLDAMDAGGGDESPTREGAVVKAKPKYLRVNVLPNPENGNGERINVRVPLSLIRAGIKLTSLIPPEAREKMNGALHEKGINFDMNSIKNEDLEELIEALEDLEVDVDSGHGRGEKIKVFVE
jgi:hypothetical protein